MRRNCLENLFKHIHTYIHPDIQTDRQEQHPPVNGILGPPFILLQVHKRLHLHEGRRLYVDGLQRRHLINGPPEVHVGLLAGRHHLLEQRRTHRRQVQALRPDIKWIDEPRGGKSHALLLWSLSAAVLPWTTAVVLCAVQRIRLSKAR